MCVHFSLTLKHNPTVLTGRNSRSMNHRPVPEKAFFLMRTRPHTPEKYTEIHWYLFGNSRNPAHGAFSCASSRNPTVRTILHTCRSTGTLHRPWPNDCWMFLTYWKLFGRTGISMRTAFVPAWTLQMPLQTSYHWDPFLSGFASSASLKSQYFW